MQNFVPVERDMTAFYLIVAVIGIIYVWGEISKHLDERDNDKLS